MVRTLIVDDEPPARSIIREYLDDFPELEVVDECGNGREAVEAVREREPDLLFLDVQMPGLSGFEVLERLDLIPAIIFSTAYDEFALQAFETGAVDYLLKPYDRDRFRTAVERALERLRNRAHDPERLLDLLQAARRTDYPDRLFVRTGRKIVPVDVADIVWIEAAGDYTKLHTLDETHVDETQGGETYLCSLGIGTLADRLDPERFLRVHRSHVIALSALEHLVSDGEGGYEAVLKGRRRVRVSRSYAAALRERIV